MAHLCHRIRIQRPAEAVFELIADPALYRRFLSGIGRWEPISEKRAGVGARYLLLLHAGSIQAGGIVQIVDWSPPHRVAWQSVSGVTQRGAWSIATVDGGSELAIEIDYEVPGFRPVGWLVERLSSRIIDHSLEASLLAARRLLEFDLPDAAAR